MSAIIAFVNGIRGYIILALVAVAVGLLYGWHEHRQGYADHETFTKLQTAMLNEAARQKEQPWLDRVNKLDTLRTQENRNAQKIETQFRADVADGKRRLSIRVKRPVCTPKPPKQPAWTMERHEPNLTDRMLKILSE